MTRFGVGVVLAPMIAAVLLAQQPSDTFTVYGAGAARCATWTEHVSNSSLHALDREWVFGFVSAAGVFAGVKLKVDVTEIDAFMAKHCEANPMDTITTAAATLVGKLQR